MKVGRRLGAVIVVAVAACSGGDDDIADPIIGAKGPATEIAAQDGWRLVAQDSDAGPCLQLHANDDSGYGCGFGVPELRSLGYFPTLLGDERFLAGPVTEDVARVRIELRDGSTIETNVIEAKEAMYVYVVRVPAGELERVVALGADEGELDEVLTPPNPWGS